VKLKHQIGEINSLWISVVTLVGVFLLRGEGDATLALIYMDLNKLNWTEMAMFEFG